MNESDIVDEFNTSFKSPSKNATMKSNVSVNNNTNKNQEA